MADSKELRTMRLMALSRAIGELEAALHTVWDDDDYFKDTLQPNLTKAIELIKDCQ